MTCPFMNLNSFWLRKICLDALITTWVQSFALITFGKPDIAANCALLLASSPTVWGTLMYRLVSLIMPASTAGMMVPKDGWDFLDPSANFTFKSIAMNPRVVKTFKWAGIAHWSTKPGANIAQSSKRNWKYSFEWFLVSVKSMVSKSFEPTR